MFRSLSGTLRQGWDKPLWHGHKKNGRNDRDCPHSVTRIRTCTAAKQFHHFLFSPFLRFAICRFAFLIFPSGESETSGELRNRRMLLEPTLREIMLLLFKSGCQVITYKNKEYIIFKNAPLILLNVSYRIRVLHMVIFLN